jgi:hypothetical protein
MAITHCFGDPSLQIFQSIAYDESEAKFMYEASVARKQMNDKK